MTFCVRFLSASGANEKPFRRVLHFGLYNRTSLSHATNSRKRPPPLSDHLSNTKISPVYPYSCGLRVDGTSDTSRESKTVLDSGLHTLDSGFQGLDCNLCQQNLDSGFRIPIVSRIPDSLSCIPDSKAQEYRFSSISDFLDSGSGFP